MNRFNVGDSVSVSKKISDETVRKYADVSDDHNPIHLDDESAKNSIFGRRVVHGMLVASYISSVIGSEFPGAGSIYMSQSLRFEAPVYIDDTISITVTIVDINDRGNATLETMVKNQEDKIVISGEALVKLPTQ